jgi:hypothetical protein
LLSFLSRQETEVRKRFRTWSTKRKILEVKRTHLPSFKSVNFFLYNVNWVNGIRILSSISNATPFFSYCGQSLWWLEIRLNIPKQTCFGTGWVAYEYQDNIAEEIKMHCCKDDPNY